MLCSPTSASTLQSRFAAYTGSGISCFIGAGPMRSLYVRAFALPPHLSGLDSTELSMRTTLTG